MTSGSDADFKIAVSMLESIEERIRSEFGNLLAIGPGHEYDARRHHQCEDLLKEVDAAAQNIRDPIVRGAAAFVRGQLYAIHGTPIGTRFTHQKAVKAFDEALQLGMNEAVVNYHLGFLHSVWDDREKAIASFQRTLDLLGVDDPMGLEAGQEIAKLRAKKSGCFVATAACGGDSTEVFILRSYRDRILIRNRFGAKFVQVYYRMSPPLAEFISTRPFIRACIREGLIRPVAFIIYRWVLREEPTCPQVR